MDHMFGWSSVVTVASQPSGQVANAGNPLVETTPGIVTPVASVVRPELKGLYAAVLLVDPPSATCHASRSATSACVAGAPTPWRMQSSQPGGSAVPPALWSGVAEPAVAVSADPPSPPDGNDQSEAGASKDACHGRWLAIGACRGKVVRSGARAGEESDRGIQDWHVPSRVLLRVYRRPARALESVVPNMGGRAGKRRPGAMPRGGDRGPELPDMSTSEQVHRPSPGASGGPARRVPCSPEQSGGAGAVCDHVVTTV